jgi:hypothetical protein
MLEGNLVARERVAAATTWPGYDDIDELPSGDPAGTGG